MGEITKIEWTATRLPDGKCVNWKGEMVNIIPGATFNPWWGCNKVSPGCKFCYAEHFSDVRYKNNHWGPSGTRKEFNDKHWNEPLKWNKQAESAGIKMKVFCGSMCDWAEDHPSVMQWRERLFKLIESTPNLIWLLLTKRPENIMKFIPEYWKEFPPKNVWYGTSVENQKYADERIPELLKVPGEIRFLSMEPLLGKVDLTCIKIPVGEINALTGDITYETSEGVGATGKGRKIDWVIVGGESGIQKDVRPMHPFWAMSIMYQCEGWKVPFFFKQWGEYGIVRDLEHKEKHVLINIEGKVYNSFEDMINDGDSKSLFTMERIGKRNAGRVLDGKEFNEYPN